MTNFLTRRNRQEPAAESSAVETRQEAFANAVAAFRQATGKAETRVVPCRCAVNGEPFAILFERMSPAHRFQIARIERTEATGSERAANGGTVFGRQPPQQSYDAGEFDWTGCVCPHCGNRAGVVYCNGCGETVCAGRVRPLPDGSKAFACHDGCGATGTTGPATPRPWRRWRKPSRARSRRCGYPGRPQRGDALPDGAAPAARPSAQIRRRGDTMADERIIVTSRGLSRLPEGEDGIPIEEVYPGEKLPRSLQGAKFYETLAGAYLSASRLKGRTTMRPSGRCGFRPDRTRSRSAMPNTGPGWNETTRRSRSPPSRCGCSATVQERYRETGYRRRRSARPADAAFP